MTRACRASHELSGDPSRARMEQRRDGRAPLPERTHNHPRRALPRVLTERAAAKLLLVQKRKKKRLINKHQKKKKKKRKVMSAVLFPSLRRLSFRLLNSPESIHMPQVLHRFGKSIGSRRPTTYRRSAPIRRAVSCSDLSS